MMDGITTTSSSSGNSAGPWKQLLLLGSLSDLKEHLSTTREAPTNLLHLAFQQRGIDVGIVQFMAEQFPHQLTQTDESGHIPLHYVCQWRSLACLPVMHTLLTSAPETILMRLREDEDDLEEEKGILPSVLAHGHGAPAPVVQYLLRRQLQANHGLVLTHHDLSYLQWSEASFLELVATALKQMANQGVIYQIRLVECRLPYESWKLLQNAMDCLPVGSLQRLQLIHLHIWHGDATSTLQQRQLTAWDMEFWQSMVTKHRETLQALELPQFYALSGRVIHQIARHLADHCIPKLQVLDARAPNSSHQTRRAKNKKTAETFAQALRSPLCPLKSLALSNLTALECMTLFQGIATNQSLGLLHLDSLVCEPKERPTVPWKTLQQALVATLQQNTSLERVLGPWPLTHSLELQHYLKLNRDYHRRDIGHWSPTLVAHVLAKEKHGTAAQQQEEVGGWLQLEPNYPMDPPSAMFYILQSRPDILVLSNGHCSSSSGSSNSKQ